MFPDGDQRPALCGNLAAEGPHKTTYSTAPDEMREPRHASWDDMDDERVLGERAGVRGRSRGGPRKSAGVLAVLAVALLVALAVPADSAKMGKPELRRNLTRAAGGLLRPNIVGGIPVPAQDSYPWMANLYDPVGHWACGGVLKEAR